MMPAMMRITVMALTLLLLAGCQVRPPVPADLYFEEAEALRQWDLSARMGYRSAQEDGSATLHWTQGKQQGEIRFSGPMGLGGARLEWDQHQATLDTGREQATAPSTGELAWQLTGLWLPIEALQYWVRGLPWPEGEAHGVRRDREGRLKELSQLGWTLEFDRYKKVAGVPLPHRIRAHHGEDRFTLVVHDWRPRS